MKYLSKIKKDFAINTKFLEKNNFNEPVYIISSNKNYVEVYETKQNKIQTCMIELQDGYNEKTFITVKEFFKKCKQDNTEYRIEKVDNGDIFIRVAYYGDLSLFYRLRKNNNVILLTNINKYKFYKTKHNAIEALSNVNYLSEFDLLQLYSYLNNLKCLKRDYLHSLKKAKNNLESNIKS